MERERGVYLPRTALSAPGIVSRIHCPLIFWASFLRSLFYRLDLFLSSRVGEVKKHFFDINLGYSSPYPIHTKIHKTTTPHHLYYTYSIPTTIPTPYQHTHKEIMKTQKTNLRTSRPKHPHIPPLTTTSRYANN